MNSIFVGPIARRIPGSTIRLAANAVKEHRVDVLQRRRIKGFTMKNTGV